MTSNASTASLLLLLQLGSRLITFTLNQALLSLTTPAAFGTATIQLEPLLNTVLFLCREGIRAALARSSSSSGQEATSRNAVLKTSLIPLGLGIPLALAAFSFYARSTSDAVYNQSYFVYSVLLYASATVVELASEPFFNRAQMAMDVKLRVGIEGSAVVVRAIVTLLVVLYGREEMALLAFAFGQFAYAATLLLRYAWHYRKSTRSGVTPSGSSNADSGVLKLAYALTKQSFFKQILTEGDKVIVSRISPIEDQGGYALALNYGSLVARILFQPLEESSRLFYSQNIGSSDKTSSSTEEPKEKSKQEASLKLLRQLVKLQVYLALVFTCFCPFYTTPLLHHVLRGSRWMKSSAPSLLKQYLFLLPVLGINGILEAFVQAVANEKQLSKMSYALLVWSGIYIVTCYFGVSVLGMKEEVLIWANGISMVCRIAYSVNFIQGYCRVRKTDADLQKVLYIARFAIIASTIAAFPMDWSESYFGWTTMSGLGKHIAVGIVCFLPCLAISLHAEKDTLKALLDGRRGRKKEQ